MPPIYRSLNSVRPARPTQYRPHISLPIYFSARPETLGNATPPLFVSRAEQLAREEDERLQGHDPSPARLRQLKDELDEINTSGERVPTYDMELKEWVTWNGPSRRLKSGVLKAVAPSGLANVPDSDMPLCPHAHNAFREVSSCRMECYRETKRGQARWVLCARQHNCIFKASQSSRQATNTPPSTPASKGNPRSPPTSQPSASQHSGSSRDIPRRLDNFDDGDEVLQRAAEVSDFMSGASRTRMHPAADRDLPPKSLFWYHPASNPKPFEQREFENSMIGTAAKFFNSVQGVGPGAFHLLITASTICTGCRNQFSIDGFRAHAPRGLCSKPKAPHGLIYGKPPIHPAADPNMPPPALLEYHPSSNPTLPEHHFDESMIGRAFLEWNSRIGIPQDAWDTVTSARVYCATCDRIRSFDGDSLHRDIDGNPYCGGRRLGWDEDDDEEFPIFGKGKGRAIDVD
ncbi:hypothetical protein FIBSPDRAFT_927281 [Athelia psychrophila]|uniref:Uncharacterized protein n=1 Tax=Athelia psychrophila TaxID=1759441 RepID=A0A166HNH6_9AGAM|nr:hypothetical protein FIBSPDRAFT_933096 [Fibularhizoctonia sp. CBS 109695]KZP28868.1 hypothetical protein FIBSPDRAFT_927281 [Fibularhizoctonia sp. CBS 109695]